MKVFKIIILVMLVVMIIAGIGLYLFLRSFDANAYKDQIAHQIGTVLETKVEIDRIDLKVSLKTGVVLDVTGLKLADEGMLTGVAVTVKSLECAVDIVHFFKTKEIMVARVIVKEPMVLLDIRRLQEKSSHRQEKQSIPEGSRDEKKEMMPYLFIKSVHLENGQVVIVGDGVNIVKDMPITGINVIVDNLSLDQSFDAKRSSVTRGPFTFQLTCAAFGSSQAVSLQGKGWLNLDVQQVRLDDVIVESDFSKFAVGQIPEIFPALKSLNLKRIDGNLYALVNQVILGQDGIPVLVAEGSLTKVGASTGLLPTAISDGDIHFKYSDETLDVLESTFKIGSGHVKFKGRIGDVLNTQSYQFDVNVSQIRLQELLPEFHPEITFSGDLNGSVVLSGTGFQLPNIIQTAKAQMGFAVGNGRLNNFNLLNYIFSRITIIPDLAQQFEEALPEEYRKGVRVDQTVFDKIDVTMSLDNGVLSYMAQLAADVIELNTKGTIDWHSQLAFNGTCSLPQKLSSSLVSQMSVLAPLVNSSNQRVVIPLADYNGPVQDFRPLPNMAYLTKMLIVSKAKDEVRNLLADVLGIKQPDSSGSPENQDSPSADSKPSVRQGIFDSLLNKVLE
jgi:hypothetical protein